MKLARPPIPSKKRAVRAEAKRFRRLGIKTSKQNNFQFLLEKRIWRAGVKKLKENCFALLAEVRRAETRSGAIGAFFVQNRFELRSVIATNQNLTIFQDERIARSPRLRRVSLRKNPFGWRLNQTAGEARQGLVWKAGGGSELRSNSSRKCGISNFFLSAFGGIQSQFLIPRFMAKGD